MASVARLVVVAKRELIDDRVRNAGVKSACTDRHRNVDSSGPPAAGTMSLPVVGVSLNVHTGRTHVHVRRETGQEQRHLATVHVAKRIERRRRVSGGNTEMEHLY